MTKRLLLPASLLALVALLSTFGTALAHTSVQAGNYSIEIGWAEEPVIVGQRNAIVVNVSDKTDASQRVDVSKLLVSMNYGGQTKPLVLQPLDENSTNQYVAPILPVLPGQYTLQLRGQIGDGTDVNIDVQPEEVLSADILAFPDVPASSGAGATQFSTWLAGGALLVSLAGLILAAVALQKARKR